MDIFNQGYAGESSALQSAKLPGIGRIERPSITERLEERGQRLRLELAEVDAALAMLKKNPEVQTVIDQLAKLNF